MVEKVPEENAPVDQPSAAIVEEEKKEEMTPEELAEQERKVKQWNDSQTLPEMGVFDR